MNLVFEFLKAKKELSYLKPYEDTDKYADIITKMLFNFILYIYENSIIVENSVDESGTLSSPCSYYDFLIHIDDETDIDFRYETFDWEYKNKIIKCGGYYAIQLFKNGENRAIIGGESSRIIDFKNIVFKLRELILQRPDKQEIVAYMYLSGMAFITEDW